MQFGVVETGNSMIGVFPWIWELQYWTFTAPSAGQKIKILFHICLIYLIGKTYFLCLGQIFVRFLKLFLLSIIKLLACKGEANNGLSKGLNNQIPR